MTWVDSFTLRNIGTTALVAVIETQPTSSVMPAIFLVKIFLCTRVATAVGRCNDIINIVRKTGDQMSPV